MFVLLELGIKNWPPPAYEMPTYVPYDASALGSVFDILKNSMKSMTNTGLLIMGACISAGLIFSVIGGFLRRSLALSDGVRRNMFRREVGNLDMKRNSGDIAVNREMNMHMNFLARQRYHKFHHDEEVEEGIYKRELAHEVDQKFREKHPDWVIENGVNRRMDSAQSERAFREQTRQQRLDDFIQRTRERDEFDAELRRQYRDRASQRIVQNRLDSMEANEILRSEHGEKLVHDAVQRSWVNDESQAAFRAQNPDRAAQRIVQNRLDSMKANEILRSEHEDELIKDSVGRTLVSHKTNDAMMKDHYDSVLKNSVSRKVANAEADMAYNYENYEIALESRAVSGVVSRDARARRDEILRDRMEADRRREQESYTSDAPDAGSYDQNIDPVTGEVVIHEIPQKRRLRLKGGKKK